MIKGLTLEILSAGNQLYGFVKNFVAFAIYKH